MGLYWTSYLESSRHIQQGFSHFSFLLSRALWMWCHSTHGSIWILPEVTLSGDWQGPCSCSFFANHILALGDGTVCCTLLYTKWHPFEITSSLFQCGLPVHTCTVNLFTGSFVCNCDSGFSSSPKGICLLNGVKKWMCLLQYKHH